MSADPTTTISAAMAKELERFPEAGRQRLADLVLASSFAGVIDGETAEALAKRMGLSVDELMVALVPIARGFAHAPISGYYVGAVARGTSGALIFGANLEFPGLALNATVHGEQAAVLHARQFGEVNISAVAIGGTACGHCRQFLAEIKNPQLRVVSPRFGSRPLADLLSDAFAAGSLGNDRGLLDPAEHELPVVGLEMDELLSAAVDVAGRSYAPYSENWSGAAVRTAGGDIIAAPYLENVAFNPSLSPLQGVLVMMRLRRLAWNEIREAVLVETRASLCSHEPATRALLASLVDVPLRVERLITSL